MSESAKKVFEGVIFDVYQWEQEMYDGTTQTFELAARPNTVEILPVTADGKILIERQQQPDRDDWFLCVVTGRCERGEEPLESAKREMREETGYEAGAWWLIDHYRVTSKLRWELFAFVAHDLRRADEPELDAGERIQLQEATFDEFLAMADDHRLERLSPSLRERCIRARYHRPSYEALKREIFGNDPQPRR